MEKKMKNRKLMFPGLLILALAILTLNRTALLADGFIVIPRPPQPEPYSLFPLEVVRHDVNVEITDQLATTTVDQEFYNPNASRLEGYYLFPLPAGGVISNFSMWIDGRETRAELLDATKARTIYEDIVRRLRDPALLEYDGRGVFKMRIFPIEPHGKKRIKISYHEILEKSNGSIAYLYPLGTEKFSAKAIPEVNIVMTIHSSAALTGIHCPTHPVKVTRPAPDRAVVSYESRNSLPDTDFKVFLTPAAGRIGFSLLTFRSLDQDGVFFFNASPNYTGSESDVVEKDITFVVDTSGSMAGRSLEQAQNAILYCLGRLNRGDRFNVIRFATEAESLFPGLTASTGTELARAKHFVSQWQAGGGTNCEEALKSALAEAGKAERPRLIVLITDGKPTIGETGDEELLRIVARASRGQLRIFPIAIGSDINTHLLDKLSEQTRTFRTYIAAGENIENGIARFYDKIRSPVLSDIRLTFSGNIRAAQIYPKDLPDLYRGTSLTVVGRYQGSGRAGVIISGRMNNRSEEFTFQADFPAENHENDFLISLWAARRVGFLLEQIRLHGENRELVDEVTRLARQYGIVTPYTSYLIVEDEKIRRDRGDLAESDMTLGRGLAASPAFAKKHREEFAELKNKSGQGSVRASSELQKLNQAEAVAETRSGDSRLQDLGRQFKTVQGRAFYLSNGVWTDARIQKAAKLPVARIAFASDDYFALLKNQPELAPVLALGRHIRFTAAGRVIEIFDPEAAKG
jgi:Ca-activated chloride channel family protein